MSADCSTKCRLVTITGPGGIGKTRVAIEVARRQSRRVVFVPLADLDRSGVAGAIFRACTAGTPSLLSGPIASGAHIVAGVWAGLAQEIARDPLVLVLDTFEHLERRGRAGQPDPGGHSRPHRAGDQPQPARAHATSGWCRWPGLNGEPGGAAVQLFHDRCRARRR